MARVHLLHFPICVSPTSSRAGEEDRVSMRVNPFTGREVVRKALAVVAVAQSSIARKKPPSGFRSLPVSVKHPVTWLRSDCSSHGRQRGSAVATRLYQMPAIACQRGVNDKPCAVAVTGACPRCHGRYLELRRQCSRGRLSSFRSGRCAPRCCPVPPTYAHDISFGQTAH
jgi:hypothetical protein